MRIRFLFVFFFVLREYPQQRSQFQVPVIDWYAVSVQEERVARREISLEVLVKKQENGLQNSLQIRTRKFETKKIKESTKIGKFFKIHKSVAPGKNKNVQVAGHHRKRCSKLWSRTPSLCDIH